MATAASRHRHRHRLRRRLGRVLRRDPPRPRARAAEAEREGLSLAQFGSCSRSPSSTRGDVLPVGRAGRGGRDRPADRDPDARRARTPGDRRAPAIDRGPPQRRASRSRPAAAGCSTASASWSRRSGGPSSSPWTPPIARGGAAAAHARRRDRGPTRDATPAPALQPDARRPGPERARLRPLPDDGRPGPARDPGGPRHLDDTVTFVLTAYLLTASVATPIIGRLGDMFGKERMLLVTLICLRASARSSARSRTRSGC